MILAIKEGPNWLCKKEEISDYFARHFEDLCHSDYPCTQEEDIARLGSYMVTNSVNAELIRIPSEEEIRRAV